MRKFKLLAVLIATMFATTNLWAEPAAMGDSGLFWEYDEGTTTLTITGSGAMPDYTSGIGANPTPWFNKVSYITSISLPSGLTKIGNYAFANCRNAALTSITIPSGVTSIGNNAFASCSSLTSMTIPSGVTTIGQAAFLSCTALESISLPNSVTSIGSMAFNSCSSLSSFTFPSGVTKIESSTFYNCIGLASIVIPSTLNGSDGIGSSAFSGCSYLSDITIENGVRKINMNAFKGCKIASLTIPASVTNIGMKAFEECDELENITFVGSSPCTMGNDVFYNCDNFEKIFVPDAYAGSYYSSWSSAYRPYLYNSTSGDKVLPPYTSLGEGTGLSYYIEDGVLDIKYDGVGTGIMPDYTKTISNRAPWYASRYSITSVTLHEGLKHIGNYAFYQVTCYGGSIDIPSGVTSIGEGAFYSCSASAISIPSSVTSIGEQAFSGCGQITSISIPSSLTSLGAGAFDMCSKVTTPIVIPEGITEIPANAFHYCQLIPSVTIHSAVTSIGMYAFASCTNLETVIIPASVTEIGQEAFWGCENLTTVTCLPTTAPTVGNVAFTNCSEDLIITYPDGADAQDYSNKFLQFWDNLRNASTGVQPTVTPHLHGVFGSKSLEWDLSFTGSTGTLLEHDGTLAITGTGAMDDYDWTNNVWAPWVDYADFINHVNIASGVTRIGESAFAFMDKVNTFIIPASVTYIGGEAFYMCNNKEMIVYSYANPENLEWHDNVSAYEGDPFVPDDFCSMERGPWGTSVFLSQATKCVVPSNYLEGYKAKWARGGEYRWYDLNVWFASELQDGESASYITTALTTLNGKTAPVVTLVRPLNRDGYFATLCLPFNMSAAQIAESSLHGAEIKEFVEAEVDGDVINVVFSPVTEIEAGKPYFVKYTNPELLGDALDRLDFMEVTINNVTPQTIEHNGVQMIGTFVPKAVEAQSSMNDGEGILFLGAHNTLFYPNAAGNIKPFRAYFHLTGGKAGAPRKGMPARIVERQNAPTAVDNATNNAQYTKRVENGQLVIERNGVRYNAAGQVVK